MSGRARAVLIWAALGCAVAVPLLVALSSPLLAWRQPVYIVAGFAGVLALGLMLVQPLLAAGLLPGLEARAGRRVHLWIGGGLVLAVLVHVGGLWITSPPDVVDALLLRSATPFSVWGVAAMWALFGVAVVAGLRRRLGLRTWRRWHMALLVVIVPGSVIHALLIQGTMGVVSKVVLCLLVLAASGAVLARLRVWTLLRR